MLHRRSQPSIESPHENLSAKPRRHLPRTPSKKKPDSEALRRIGAIPVTQWVGSPVASYRKISAVEPRVYRDSIEPSSMLAGSHTLASSRTFADQIPPDSFVRQLNKSGRH